jgi:hypothetical protein
MGVSMAMRRNESYLVIVIVTLQVMLILERVHQGLSSSLDTVQ